MTKRKKIVVGSAAAVVLGSLLFVSQYLFGATVYVDNAGSMSADCTSGNYHITNRNCTGSAGNAYRTPQAAASNLNAGDIVEIRGGTYAVHSNNATINCGATSCDWGTIGNVITWRTYLSETVTFNGGISIYAVAGHDWTFQDIIIGLNGLQAQCFIWGANVGDFANTPKRIRFEGGSCLNTGSDGGLIRGEGIVFSGTTFQNNGDTTDDPSTHALYFTGQNINNIVENCIIDSPATFGIHVYDVSGTGASGNIFRYNTIKNVRDSVGHGQGGIYMGASGNTVYSNLIYDFTALESTNAGIEVQYTATQNNNKIYNNTILLPSLGRGILIASTATNTIIQNNIVMGGNLRIENGSVSTTCTANLTSDSSASGCATLVDTAANTWTNSATDDFTLKVGSKAIGAGVNLASTLGYSLDITGATRSVPWDLGAYAYVSATPNITLSSPTGGSFTKNTAGVVSWTASNLGSTQRVDFSLDGGSTYSCPTCSLASGIAEATKSASVTWPNTATSNGKLRVCKTDLSLCSTSGTIALTDTAGGPVTVIISNNTSGDKIGIGGVTSALLGQDQPNFNFNTASGIRANKYAVGSHTHTVLKFPTNTIPSTATVTAAELGLYLTAATNAGTPTIDFRNNKRDFVENQATWNIYSTGNNWGTAGGLGAADRDSTVVCAMTFDADLGEYKTCSGAGLTAWVQSLVNLSTPNNGLHLERNGSETNILRTFGAANPTAAYLSITYTTTAPSISVTQPPVSGHVFPGQTIPVRWTAQGVSNTVTITLSRDGGANYDETIASSIPFNQSDFSWQITRGRTNSNCYITVCEDLTGICGVSSAFRIGGEKRVRK